MDKAKTHPIRTIGIVLLIIMSILALSLGLVYGLRARNSNDSNNSSTFTPGGPAANLVAVPPASKFPSTQEAFVSFAIEFYYFPDFAGTVPMQMLRY